MAPAYSYDRYLAAKRTIDDRALNRQVLGVLREELGALGRPISALEIGSGVGTMAQRMVDWGLVTAGDLTLVDADTRLQQGARRELAAWAAATGRMVEQTSEGLRVWEQAGPVDVRVKTIEDDAPHYLAECSSRFDLFVACAVLDLLDAPSMLEALVRVAAPRALLWLSINFDGETIFCPEHDLDRPLLAAYHRSMDERIRNGRPAGDSRTGRHLFSHLASVGASILAAGSSDWVVHSKDGSYPAEEAHFLECILKTIQTELEARRDVDQASLALWLKLRFAELERGELVYIAHQLDFAARVRD